MSAAWFVLASAAAAGSVTEEAAVREFATICVAHFRDLAGVKRAAAASSRRYALRDDGDPRSSLVWTSPGISIDYFQGFTISARVGPQCALTADLARPADPQRVYAAVAALPGAARIDVGSGRWFGGKAWVLPGTKTAVARVDAARPRQITLSLQPAAPARGTR